MVGGPPVTQDFADRIGADSYGIDAPHAVIGARELVKELVDALRTAEEGAAEGPEDELAFAVTRFGQLAYAASTGVELERGMTLRAARIGVSSDGLNFLKAEEAFFVTPADLLNRCENLTQVGTIPA